ncbi:MAG: Sec-independent protein translocase protein TatB [Henriciella sp.]|jgi:sec-independent protein translocase protein TatB
MLPQFGFSELLLVAVVALIVVGPKDLPVMMRRLGQFVARGRAMATEFRAAFDDIARESELEALREEIESLKRDNAVSQAASDLRAVEQEINNSVMASSDPVANQKQDDAPARPDEDVDEASGERAGSA